MEPKAVYGHQEMEKDIRLLVSKFEFVRTAAIGESVQGRPIPAIRIGEGPFRWHFNGACHANEWITSLLLMKFAEQYAEACRHKGRIAGKPAEELLRRNTLWIVPMVNPDGVERVRQGRDDWKANARGVDLNDQFPAFWEEERSRRQAEGPGPRDYGGPSPLSEPEASALAAWTGERDFGAVLALHTQGEEIYWNYRNMEPACSEEWVNRMARASGYRSVYLEGSDAGYKDWFIYKFRRPGFTVEAGSGVNPLPPEQFPAIFSRVLPLLAEALDLAP